MERVYENKTERSRAVVQLISRDCGEKDVFTMCFFHSINVMIKMKKVVLAFGKPTDLDSLDLRYAISLVIIHCSLRVVRWRENISWGLSWRWCGSNSWCSSVILVLRGRMSLPSNVCSHWPVERTELWLNHPLLYSDIPTFIKGYL